MPSPFDDMTLDEIAALAQKYTTSDSMILKLKGENDEGLAAFWLQVLQAKAALEAAKRQREAIEEQTEISVRLVHVTWWLVGVTALLAGAAIVALFLRA